MEGRTLREPLSGFTSKVNLVLLEKERKASHRGLEPCQQENQFNWEKVSFIYVASK
jgi:hypothetical protein